MSTSQPVRIERRAAQRFEFHIPVSIRLLNQAEVGCGFTQNLSARGVLIYTDVRLCQGDAVEVGLSMPSEITLAESMPVRCRGKILRVTSSGAGSKAVVAVYLEGYEFLPETAEAPLRRTAPASQSDEAVENETGPQYPATY